MIGVISQKPGKKKTRLRACAYKKHIFPFIINFNSPKFFHSSLFVCYIFKVPMRNFRFRTFVRSGLNRNIINHEVVQKVVTRKVREPL